MSERMVRAEIGSEFWSVPTTDTRQVSFPDNTEWFISGTSALYYILKDIANFKEVTSAAVPSWCCSCMIEPFVKHGLKVYFYSVYVDQNGVLTCDYTTAPPCDLTLVISYFGYSDQGTIGKPHGIVIRDLTHSIFEEPNQDASYYFGSMRKWAGFWTGGYAYKQGEWHSATKLNVPELDPEYENLRIRAMNEKLQYLQGEREDKEYLHVFQEAEDYLDRCGIMKGGARDIAAAASFDVRMVRQKRRANVEYLLSELKEYAVFRKLGSTDCPLFFPILLKDEGQRDRLRKHLIANQIFCPVHWALTDLHQLTEAEQYLYKHELSIVCDQRYSVDDMRRIVSCIRQFLQEGC